MSKNSVQIQQDSKLSVRHLKYLPSFANYLLQHHLRQYAEQQVKFSFQLELPLLKVFKDLSRDQLIVMVMESAREFLGYLAENKAEEQIESSLIKWIKNQLPLIDQNDVVAEDITLVTFIRKKTMLEFVAGYCNSAEDVVSLIEEIDLFLIKAETEYSNTYIDLLRNRIKEQSYLNEKIANTSPVLIYLLNLQTGTISFINETAEKFLGLTQHHLVALGTQALETIIHPQDLLQTRQLLNEIKTNTDQEIWSYECRLKDANGNYVWMNNTICIFKKDAMGLPQEIIGNIINIQSEKEKTEELQKGKEELRRSEALYKQAQALSHIGHFTLDLKTQNLYLTDELKRIYGLDLEKQQFHLDDLIKQRHIDDKDYVQNAIEHTLKTFEPFAIDFRIQVADNTQKKVHAIGEVKLDENRNVTQLVGTIQDVTERHDILEKLQQRDRQHKQAEALTHIGSYSWDLEANQISWTDEMYRIYQMNPQEKHPITPADLVRYTHPDDIQHVREEVDKAIKEKKPHDFYYRIITDEGTVKILHARGDIIYRKDDPVCLVGTTQDVTEKQLLIRKLRESENVYKQAEAIANMGNFVLDLATHQIEWTDQLFIIHDLEPQSEKINLERFYSFIHPEDLPTAHQVLKDLMKSGTVDFTFRIITAKKQIKTLRTISQVKKDEKGNAIRIIGTTQDITERQNLLLKLQESEKLHKQAQGLAKLGNWTMDLGTKIYTWSDEMYNIYEVKKGEEFTVDKWAAFIHPDDRQAVLDYFEQCLREKTSYNRHHRILLPSGKIKMLHRKGEFVFDSQGHPLKLIGTTQDVTEQFRIQQELKENQTFIQKIADATPAIITSYNVNTGRYTFISEGIKLLLGYEPEEIKEKGVSFISALVHPDDLPQLVEKNNQSLMKANLPENRHKDEVMEFIYRLKHKDGHYAWFHTYGTIFDRNAAGQVEHVLNISLDVTDQHEAVKKIEEQEHFIQHIADASPTVLYVFDIESNSIVYVNREIFFVLGFTREEIMDMGGKVTEQLYHPDDIELLPERKQSKKKILDTDLLLQYECRMKNKDGDWQWFLVREVVFKTDEKGTVLQTVGAALDITKRKEMEKTLLQNSFQLEQSNASLEEFAYVASHDLKEPLRKISTFGDRLADSQVNNLTPEGKLYLKKIVDASQRMQVMISDLLSISMISGNKEFEPTSLQQIFKETLQTLEFKIEQKNAIITSDQLPVINAIPSQFRQLFQNLISNSLKFVHENIQPQITVTHSYLKPEEVARYQLPGAEKYLKLEFNDNGIGFENEYAGKIFAIFQRLHGRSEYEGSGIGLAICKKIVEHHGGVIYAAGVPDVGATFSIILPS